jgi:Fe2+ transport system protein FeoA
MMLHQTTEGSVIRIVEILESRHLRRSLSQMGVQIGDIVRVQGRVAYGGPILIVHRGVQIALGRSLAARIRVAPVG